MKQIIECVPNFSEGRNPEIIRQIAAVIEQTEGVQLLDVDPGKATNRTVVTFAGEPEAVVEAAFRAIREAAQLIDMAAHTGEHPRMGATDVCPLVPISGISLEETAQWAKRLAERVGNELQIPVYLYEAAASRPERCNLATIRSGEYEALPQKLADPEWAPDFGPAQFNSRSGATVIGARDFLVAYNANLNTTSVRRANSVAFDVREQGRVLRDGDPVTGPVRMDENGEPMRIPGACKAVKAIGWYIEEYGIAQVSMNLTDINVTPLHEAFEACCRSAESRGMRVSGSEIVGMVPLRVLLDAGRYFLHKQKRSAGVSDEELLRIAVRSMGLDDLAPFDPKQKVIEYKLQSDTANSLIAKNLVQFADETASESPAPGGGSISAYVGALGASLAAMVANLSSHKRGWDERWEEFSDWAVKAQEIKQQLLALVDEDTRAFNAIMDAFQLPKNTPSEKTARAAAIESATRYAIETPLKTMQLAIAAFDSVKAMVEQGNPNSVTDAGVGALCARAAVHGAGLNVLVNTAGLKDKAFAGQAVQQANAWMAEADLLEKEIIALVMAKMS
ncbi:MAG: glutamate formimidoyltransferase [Saprospiraceae bacterium]|nr:glutamate formimidoyltransferase [Saprospiraceae bacterium]